MRQWLLILLTAACLLVYPFAAFGADYGSQSSQTQQVPPVAQPLVREGDFAIKLAAELDLGNPADEASAEDMLAKAGIVPANGWLSDYPVTPEIVGQLQSSLAKAAAEGRLPMNADEATRGLYSVASRMNLPVPSGPSTSEPESQQPSAVQSNPTVINNYYNDQGPPIVTYYPPPYYDAYLYDWVPYPAFWFGYWFPGFYICHSFTTVVVVRDDDFGDRGRRGIVSNRVIDPVTRRIAVVDPITKTSAGVRPVSMLRTDSGGSFRNITEMRRGYGMSATGGTRQGTIVNGPRGISGFRTPEARRSAEAIYSQSVERMRTGRGPERTVNGYERRFSMPSGQGGRFPGMPKSPVRTFNAPARGNDKWRSVSPGPRSPLRQYHSPSRGGEWRSPGMPGAASRSLSAPVARGNRGWSFRPSSGEGLHTGVGRRVFSNGMCRGRC